MQDNEGARVLVLGASGRTGGMIAAALEAFPTGVAVVRASRDHETVERWRAEGRAAVHLDLDDARTFPTALEGIDRLFLMAGYTVAMTHQAKTIVDAAVDAGVGFIVHLGIFGNGRSTDPHFAWHELVERYIEGSGIPWTHLHPHMFMENLLTSLRLRDGRLPWPMGDKPTGWIAVDDMAAVAAKVLAEGPEIHAGKGYWMSTDLLNGVQAADILRQALDHPVTAQVMTPDDLLRRGSDAAPSFMEVTYAASVMEWLRQTYDGRMDYAAVTTSTVEELLGRPPLHLADWATRNRQALLNGSDHQPV
ncbi:NmrA family NAD(P)-binding protein [Planotetraspora kaengkrachanensis]|uniref:Nucleotide-diphosphate-sugar epimerase n=1 Tax=Planotetraspora kaengkrachanensis TaxID=575193 RepID=A0A8J3LTI7_9ACTN|nr:NmrA family NAD(P)-binding protein [Planotetraspora kaengkrachanensis]GIG78477.1 nucleotide-diphosphate-sugar epimerase [Planotetraspora kaengkrachanensis]